MLLAGDAAAAAAAAHFESLSFLLAVALCL
jgi:hypothetical protein